MEGESAKLGVASAGRWRRLVQYSSARMIVSTRVVAEGGMMIVKIGSAVRRFCREVGKGGAGCLVVEEGRESVSERRRP